MDLDDVLFQVDFGHALPCLFFEMQCACAPNVGDGADAVVFYLKVKQRLWSQWSGEDSGP